MSAKDTLKLSLMLDTLFYFKTFSYMHYSQRYEASKNKGAKRLYRKRKVNNGNNKNRRNRPSFVNIGFVYVRIRKKIVYEGNGIVCNPGKKLILAESQPKHRILFI